MADPAAELARRIATLEGLMQALTRASQISRSTIPVEGEDVPVPAAIEQARFDFSAVSDALEAARSELDAYQEELTANLADAEESLTQAQERLGEAETALEVFGTELEGVVTSIQGVNKTLHGTGEPGDLEAPDGSVYFRHVGALSGPVDGQWTRVAGAWEPTPLTSEAIANLDVGKLTAGSAAIADLVAQKIAAASGQFLELDVRQLVASDATLSEAVIQKLFAEVVVARMQYAEKFIGGSALIDGSVTAEQMVAEVMNGQTIRGAYIEAPILASSENLGTGANTLADPEFASQVDSAWVMSGHTGDADFVQRDTITWDKTGTGSGVLGDPYTWRARGNVVADLRIKPIDRVTGDVLANHRSGIVAGTARSFNLSSQVTADPTMTYDAYKIAGKAGATPAASSSSRTTYLTNTNAVALVSGETWTVNLRHVGLTADTAGFVQAWVQVVDASTSAVIWERALSAGELANGSPISASFVAPATQTAKFRIKATYTAAGAGLTRLAQSGSYVRRDITAGSSIFGPYNENITGRAVDPDGVNGITTNIASTWPAAVWNKARTRWRVTRAVFAKVAPEKGYRIDQDNGFQLFSASGAQTGQLDGENNFLAGRFATAESGERVELSNSLVRWFNQFGVQVAGISAAQAAALVESTGWLTLGLGSDLDGSCRYRAEGRSVELTWDITGSFAGDTSLTAALPSAFRPPAGAATTIFALPAYIDPPSSRPNAVVYLDTASGVLRATGGGSTITRVRGRYTWIR